MHPMEHRKEKNGTGHLTALQLVNSEVIVGVDFSENDRVNEILTNKEQKSFLVYPGKESFNLSAHSHTAIQKSLGFDVNFFILDGTWPCAKKMLRKSKNLQTLERVSFDNKVQSKFIIKQQPNSLCLSTIESVYTILKLLKNSGLEEYDTDNFLLPFEKMIEYQVECILNPNNESYCSRKKKRAVLVRKDNYKKATQRNIIFEGNIKDTNE